MAPHRLGLPHAGKANQDVAAVLHNGESVLPRNHIIVPVHAVRLVVGIDFATQYNTGAFVPKYPYTHQL